jgi:hypothetical protein
MLAIFFGFLILSLVCTDVIKIGDSSILQHSQPEAKRPQTERSEKDVEISITLICLAHIIYMY